MKEMALGNNQKAVQLIDRVSSKDNDHPDTTEAENINPNLDTTPRNNSQHQQHLPSDTAPNWKKSRTNEHLKNNDNIRTHMSMTEIGQYLMNTITTEENTMSVIPLTQTT